MITENTFACDVIVQIGMIRMNWKFSRLTTTAEEMHLETPQGHFVFTPDEVTEIANRWVMLPFLTRKIEIKHVKTNDIGSPVLLWSGFPPVDIAKGIFRVGFVPKALVPQLLFIDP